MSAARSSTPATAVSTSIRFTPDDDLVPDTANLIDVVKSLAINQQCFVTILDRVGAIITLTDLEKPPMRMFLFGMITMGRNGDHGDHCVNCTATIPGRSSSPRSD